MWSLVYALAGAGAIVALTGYLIADAIDVAYGHFASPAPPWPRRWSAVGALLVVLWLAAAVLR